MEVLVLDGKNYVKASKAAKDLGYATDYVGQLCRSGQVDAHLIGRTWYVNQEQLGSHRVEKKRISRVKAREQAKKAIEEHKLKVTETTNTYRNIDIQYEGDDSELIPATKKDEAKKLEIKSESAHARAIAEAEFEEQGGNIIDNEGDKVLMSGDLTVVDVTDGPSDDDTVTLTPRMMRSRPEEKVIVKEKTVSVSEEGGESSIVPLNKERKIPTFTERLNIQVPNSSTALDSSVEDTPEALKDEEVLIAAPIVSVLSETSSPKQVPKKASVVPYYLVLFLIFSVVLFSLPITMHYVYEDNNKTKLNVQFVYQYKETFDKIQLKIKESRLNKNMN